MTFDLGTQLVFAEQRPTVSSCELRRARFVLKLDAYSQCAKFVCWALKPKAI